MKINYIHEHTPPQGHKDLEIQHPIKSFTVLESIWGKFIVCRSAQYHPELMVKTGTTVHPVEIETIANIISILPDNCVIIDAGANVGAFCVPMTIAAKKKKGIVYAFEVQKKLYRALCGTVVLNDFDNLEVFNMGLGSKEDTLKIPKVNYNANQDFGIVSLTNQQAISQSEFEYVDIVSVDQLNFERLDFFKIDVEGMELDILQGGSETIRTFRPYLWIEYWNSNTTLIREFFMRIGDYTIYQITGADILCVPNEKAKAKGLVINCPVFNK